MRNSPFLPLFILIAGVCITAATAAQNIDIAGPTGSGGFGTKVAALPNGNIVVTDPYFDTRDGQDVGAVHLYDGATGTLISTMTGSRANDNVGNEGVTILSDGDFLVRSSLWDNGSIANASAITRCSRTSGCPPTVTNVNSLVGSANGDNLGFGGITVLSSGNYVIVSPYWDKPFNSDAGAVTWCHKTNGCPPGFVSSFNSLTGSLPNDKIGIGGLYPLANGNYVIRSPWWKSFTSVEGGWGAVTWGSGTTGVTGEVTAANSLVGSHGGDGVGYQIYILPSGNYVVSSPDWDNGTLRGAGAATFGNGNTGTNGPITAANSLIGTKQGDIVSNSGITVLTNGNYVVASSGWDNETVPEAGAVTWGSGTTGVTGDIKASNSLVGTIALDGVGMRMTALTNGNYVVTSEYWHNRLGAVTWGSGASGVTGPVSEANSLTGAPGAGLGQYRTVPLTNGNYVVCSPFSNNNGVTFTGAATWGNGATGTTGVVSSANSLVGTSDNDRVCIGGVVALNNGNYLVVSPNWDLGDTGAVTWGDGTTGVTGAVSSSNSLTGNYGQDSVGSGGATALANGNYVVASPLADTSSSADAGAVTWGNGSVGITGVVGDANSLTGTNQNDKVGFKGITALANGNYVVASPNWQGNTGAATWGSGSGGVRGAVTSMNSLVGSAMGDLVSDYGITALANGNYVVRSAYWDNGPIDAAGAVSRGTGGIGTRGFLDPSNSVAGTTASGGTGQNFVFDTVNNQFVIGRPADNVVTLWRIAANVSIAGRVTDANGSPIPNAIIRLVDSGGQVRTAQTGSLGYYLFDAVPTGQNYTISVSAKRYRFASPQSIFIDNNIADLNFVARP